MQSAFFWNHKMRAHTQAWFLFEMDRTCLGKFSCLWNTVGRRKGRQGCFSSFLAWLDPGQALCLLCGRLPWDGNSQPQPCLASPPRWLLCAGPLCSNKQPSPPARPRRLMPGSPGKTCASRLLPNWDSGSECLGGFALWMRLWVLGLFDFSLGVHLGFLRARTW